MRQVNIAQRFVNVVAMVRSNAIVAVVEAASLLTHLLKRMTGTTENGTRHQGPGGYPWSPDWHQLHGRMQAQPAFQPVAKTISRPTTCKSS